MKIFILSLVVGATAVLGKPTNEGRTESMKKKTAIVFNTSLRNHFQTNLTINRCLPYIFTKDSVLFSQVLLPSISRKSSIYSGQRRI